MLGGTNMEARVIPKLCSPYRIAGNLIWMKSRKRRVSCLMGILPLCSAIRFKLVNSEIYTTNTSTR